MLSELKVIFCIFGWDVEGIFGIWWFDNIVIDGIVEVDVILVVSCSIFMLSFDFCCLDEVSFNVFSGGFGLILEDGIIFLGLGFLGLVFYDLDFSICVFDEEFFFGDFEICFVIFILGISDGCS